MREGGGEGGRGEGRGRGWGEGEREREGGREGGRERRVREEGRQGELGRGEGQREGSHVLVCSPGVVSWMRSSRESYCELRAVGIPEKYCAEVSRRITAPPPSFTMSQLN